MLSRRLLGQAVKADGTAPRTGKVALKADGSAQRRQAVKADGTARRKEEQQWVTGRANTGTRLPQAKAGLKKPYKNFP